MSTVQNTTLAKLEADQRPGAGVWVLNVSADSILAREGEVLLSIPKPNGNGYTSVTIAQTWLPQNLCDFCPKDQLLAAPELREAIRNGLVQLVTEEYAQEILEDEDAELELQTLADRKRQIRNAGAAKSLTDDDKGISVYNNGKPEEDDDTFNMGAGGRKAATEYTDNRGRAVNVSAAHAMWCDRQVQRSDAEVINAIKSKRRFNRAEVEYMVTAFADKPRTAQMLREQLASKPKK